MEKEISSGGLTMPDIREKLIELIRDIERYGHRMIKGVDAYEIADHLIANGVTISNLETVNKEWISVKDRLPSDDIPSAMYLCYWKGMIRVCKYWRTRKCFELRGKVVKVTHWMPLPEPPEEDDYEPL